MSTKTSPWKFQGSSAYFKTVNEVGPQGIWGGSRRLPAECLKEHKSQQSLTVTRGALPKYAKQALQKTQIKTRKSRICSSILFTFKDCCYSATVNSSSASMGTGHYF